MIGAAVAGLAAAGIAAHGTWHRNSVVFGRVLTHLPGDEPIVSITFDDGPNPRTTPRVLDVLRHQLAQHLGQVFAEECSGFCIDQRDPQTLPE